MTDMDPKQQRFSLILLPFFVFVAAIVGVQTGLSYLGIIKPPPKKYENNWDGHPW